MKADSTYDPTNLAAEMVARRHELGYYQKDAVAAAKGGISTSLWSKIENSHRDRYSRSTFAAIDRALQWDQGRALRLASGEATASASTAIGKAEVVAEIAELRARLDQLEAAILAAPPSGRPGRQRPTNAH